jgi:D-ornithine 4,5-aminomutase subunit alpha
MSLQARPDDFVTRRTHLQHLSDAELHAYFWRLVEHIVQPLVEEARTHTSPSIERSVLLRMGFSSLEAKALVTTMLDKGLLGHGAGHLVLQLAHAKGLTVREAGLALLAGTYWEECAACVH